MAPPKEIKQISEAVWELPTTFKKGMNVPARIYATKKLLNDMDAGVFEQVTNVACLPGIQKYAYCMPDGHWGLFNNVQVLSTKTGFPSAAWRHLT